MKIYMQIIKGNKQLKSHVKMKVLLILGLFCGLQSLLIDSASVTRKQKCTYSVKILNSIFKILKSWFLSGCQRFGGFMLAGV